MVDGEAGGTTVAVVKHAAKEVRTEPGHVIILGRHVVAEIALSIR